MELKITIFIFSILSSNTTKSPEVGSNTHLVGNINCLWGVDTKDGIRVGEMTELYLKMTLKILIHEFLESQTAIKK